MNNSICISTTYGLLCWTKILFPHIRIQMPSQIKLCSNIQIEMT
jgi:hypothetical protein